MVFTIGALVHMFGITFYGIFACGELQDWAEPPVQEQTVWSPSKAGFTEETSFVSCFFFHREIRLLTFSLNTQLL